MKYILNIFLLFLITINANDFKNGLQAFHNKDFKKAKPLLLRSCKNDNYKGCAYLGFIYLNIENNKGYKKDISKAERFFVKACNNNEAIGCRGLGAMYEGDKKIKYYEIACNLGDTSSCYNLASDYEHGFNIGINLEKALDFYSKMNNQKGHISYKKLKEKIDMTPRLFDLILKNSTRDELWNAISRQKLKIIRQNKNYWVDKYDSSMFLKGSTLLTMYYLSDGSFVQAEFKFPESMNTKLIHDVKELVIEAYRQYDKVDGQLSVGKMSYRWDFYDGMKILVSRGWPDTTTYLTFYYPKRIKKLNEEIDSIKNKTKYKNPLIN